MTDTAAGGATTHPSSKSRTSTKLTYDFEALEQRLFDQIGRNQELQNAAIEASLKSIDTLRKAGITTALFLFVLGAILTFMGFDSFSDVTNFAKREVLKAVSDQTEDTGEIFSQILSLKERYESATAEADTLLDKLMAVEMNFSF